MQKKAMVVDSDFFFVEFLGGLLSKRGYAVLKAYDGKESIALLENNTIDILFADLVLPKVDSREFFKFVQTKHNGNKIPIVALSGIMIEQLGALEEIGADFFIAKGPIDQLAVKLNEFMAEFESQPFSPPVEKKVIAAGNVFPRRDAMMLLDSLKYQQAVFESAAMGIIVVDIDTRVISANRAAVKIIGRDSVELLNCPLADVFENNDRAELANGLSLVKQKPETEIYTFYAKFNAQVTAAIISATLLNSEMVGWTIVLHPMPPID